MGKEKKEKGRSFYLISSEREKSFWHVKGRSEKEKEKRKNEISHFPPSSKEEYHEKS